MKKSMLFVFSYLTCAVALYAAPGPVTNVVFFDDFEASMANWTPTGSTNANWLDWSSAQNITPPGPGHAARVTNSLNRMYHNLGTEVSGWSVATFYMYDSSATRAYGEVRCYTGSGYNQGSLQNLYAIGKYISTDMIGEVFDPTKYQGRIANGPGPSKWFNLNAAGAPSRSPGWHRFDIVRQSNGTSYDFYVDGVLSRSFAGVTDYPWDCAVIGSVAGGFSSGDAWFDGVTVGTLTLPPPPPEHFFKAKVMPPPDGVYVTPALWHAAFNSGIVIRDVRHRRFTSSVALPSLGTNLTHTFGSQVEMDVSTDSGGTWTRVAAPSGVSAAIEHTADAGATEVYATEMLSLTASGGSLPANIQIRESPTRAGTGGTTMRPVPGGYMVSSFFDIFIEVSIDGGQTWEPASQSAHVELRSDPALVATVPTPTRLLPPPNDQYVSPADYHIALANGIIIRDIKHKLFTQSVNPPPVGAAAALHHFDSQLDFELSTDGGHMWVPVRTPASVDVQIRRLSSGEEELYDTEMLSLTTSGSLPANIQIRESPTEPSRGMTAIGTGGGGGGGGGGAMVSSFFDIFTEISTDGGQSWASPTNGPARVEARSIGPEEPFPSDTLPPPGGQYVSPERWHALFANGIVISNVVHFQFMQSFPPPLPGRSATDTFGSMVRLDIAMPMGSFQTVTVPVSTTVRITSTQEDSTTRYFETEMELLELTGSTLPGGVMIRESPTRASSGRTSLRSNGVDNDCDSFFDIFIEVSTDGGQSWSPSVSGPATMVLIPLAPRPLSITCPADITVTANQPGGAVVNYPPPTPTGGCLPVAVTCDSPVGNLFPLGPTPVTCTATDACGQSAQCAFKVTVQRRRAAAHFFRERLLPPPEGMYISPQQWHASFQNGIVISNVAHRDFTQSVLPPTPSGPPVIHTFSSQVELEVSTGGGGWQSFVGNASMTVQTAHAGFDGDEQIIDNQVQEFIVQGPAGIMIRESPTLASSGQTTIKPVPGGYMIDSFFDIFTEVSTDNGGSWTPASQPAHMELKLDPALIPPVVAPRPVLPMPNGQYVSPQQWHQLYASGIILRDVKHKLFTQWVEPPLFGQSQTHTFDSQLDFQLSMDGGNHWTVARAPGVMMVSIRNVREFAGQVTYETDVLQLDIAGGDLPANVQIRESSTKLSEGGTAIAGGGGGGGGGYMVSSFFDIFTEVSTDGGGTWAPATNGPARVELERVAPVHEFPSNVLPPPDGEYVSPQQWHAYFAQGIIISNVVHHRFMQPVVPPAPGTSLSHTFDSQVEMDVSMNGGGSWQQVSAPATVGVQITGRLGGDGITEYYDTEMTHLVIQGGGGTMPFAVRESPSKASLGRATISSSLVGYQMDSFFDIFIEVSTDGGQTWLPTLSGPATVTLQPAGTPPTLTIACPPNQVVQAVRPGGAMVAYPAPTTSGGVPPITVTCTPSSGDPFRVGVTPVTCVARDSIGQTARCTFTVKVLPPKRFFRSRLLPPGDGMYISPQQWHALYANGIVISNVIHKRFTQGIEPPLPGVTVEDHFGSEVQLEVATGPTAVFQPHTAIANVTVRIHRSLEPTTEEIYDTEMLQLDLHGGTLPPNIRMRLSPLTPSLGETHILPVAGGSMVSSFFDVFTEISTDGGLTWSPSPDSAAVELTIDPTTVPPVVAPTTLLPPLVHQYVSPQDWHVAFANGVVITDVRHAVFTGAILPPPYGPGASHTFDSQVDMLVSTGLGAPRHMRAPATMTVAAQHLLDFTDTQYLETEALQLDVAGGDLPANFRLRESPTLPSRGGTCVTGGGGASGGCHVSSFFDIWVELSTDGGATWLASTSGPVRVELQTIAPEAQFLTPVLPPPTGAYVSPEQWHAYYAQGIIISNVIHRQFTQSLSPPPPGDSQVHSFDSEVDMMVYTPAGTGWSRMIAPARVQVRVTSLQDQDATRYFDTEMLMLNISGGDLPGGVMIRESPTKASTGRTSERGLVIESFMISSFFDVFTELSTDGGQTWSPSLTGPATVYLVRDQQPPEIIDEPNDTTAYCFSNAVFCARAAGTPPLSYQWYVNGLPMSGATQNCLVVSNVTMAQNGNTYHVVVTNPHGSDTSRQAGLIVLDVTPPAIQCPPDQAAETDSGRCDAVVQYLPPVPQDACGTVTNVTCIPRSGSVFLLGPTIVICSAYDQSGNSNGCVFTVVVADRERPIVTCPPDMTVTAYAPTGAVVNYPAPVVTDNCGVLKTNCTPPSGSVFLVGTTNVTCVATDTSDNVSNCQFRVTVQLIGIEVDRFDYSLARITVESPLFQAPETVTLAGPTVVEVYLDPVTGKCADLDGDTRDQALAQMTQLDLAGNSPMGPMRLRLRPGRPTWGEVEERNNATRDILDLSPFVMPPMVTYADSFFDVWFEVEIPGPGPALRHLHSLQPVRMVAVLTHKPPAIGEAYTNAAPVELVDEAGQLTDIVLKEVIHIPNPGRETDRFPWSEARLLVRVPNQLDATNVFLRGPCTVDVGIPDQGWPRGWAADTDGDGLDQAPNVMTQLELQGLGPLGPVTLRLDPNHESRGDIEERVNHTRGILDVAPFTLVNPALADSFFDVFFTIETGGMILHPDQPAHMVALLRHKPPLPGEAYTNLTDRPIQLLTPDGQPTGVEILGILHIPVPLPCPRLDISRPPVGPSEVVVCWQDDGRDCRLQYALSLDATIQWHSWTGFITELPGGIKCVRIVMPGQGQMMFFRLCGGCPPLP